MAFCKLNFSFVAIIFCQIFIALMCSDRGVQDLLPLISILGVDSDMSFPPFVDCVNNAIGHRDDVEHFHLFNAPSV